MAAEPIEAPKATQSGLTAAERQELQNLRAYRRRSQMQESISFGVLGLGVMLSGFGPIGTVAGMILGALAGYLVERRAQAASTASRS
jgi:hypothetical protein